MSNGTAGPSPYFNPSMLGIFKQEIIYSLRLTFVLQYESKIDLKKKNSPNEQIRFGFFHRRERRDYVTFEFGKRFTLKSY